MAFLIGGANSAATAAAYEVANSCRFNDGDSPVLEHTTVAGGDRKTITISVWVKRGVLGTTQVIMSDANNDNDRAELQFNSSDQLRFFNNDDSSTTMDLVTNRLFRDCSAWYHIVVAVDTTQGTESNRVKLYINGVQETDFDAEQYPDQNEDLLFGHFSSEHFQLSSNDGDNAFSGYMAEHYWIDGTQYAATDFGEFDEDSGIWIPKKFTGTFGSEGHYLNFDTSGSLGADSSGNSNTFGTLNNIDATNQCTDSPTNNFCTLNPLWVYGNPITTGPSDGNLKVSGGAWAGTKATMGVDKGKWYWEYKSNNVNTIIGIQTDEGVALTGNGHNIISTCALYLDGEVWIKDSTSGRNDTDVTQTFDADEVYGIALNMDDNQISFYQDGSLITNGGSIALDGLADKYVFPFASNYNSIIEFNFGNPIFSISSAAADANGYGTFEHAPPSGYYALCTKNLAEYG